MVKSKDDIIQREHEQFKASFKLILEQREYWLQAKAEDVKNPRKAVLIKFSG